MFKCEPQLELTQYLDSMTSEIQQKVGDIREPWVTLGSKCGISEFAAKALFALGMMRRYILSANMILKGLRWRGFLSAYGSLGSGVELLGRCIHPNEKVRQSPALRSGERLEAGFEFIRRSGLPSEVVVETNHYSKAVGGYSVKDLKDLRNLVVHGGCLTSAPQIKGDIELLHELRKAFYGIPAGEKDLHRGEGPIEGAIDRYCNLLIVGDTEKCKRLATAGISPGPLQLQQGNWRFDAEVVLETKKLIEDNLSLKRPPISGRHTKACDYFQLYPD